MAEVPQAPSWIAIEKEAGPATKEALRLLWLQQNKATPAVPDVRFIGHPITTGMVIAYAGSENPDPDNYGICDHHEESRVTRAALFARIGTRYGIGDGSTTFNVPDYRKRPIVGTDPRDPDFAEPGKAGGDILSTLTVPAHAHPVSGTTNAIPAHDHAVSGVTSDEFSGVTVDISTDSLPAESDAVTPIDVITSVSGNIQDVEHGHSISFTSGSGGGSAGVAFSTTSDQAAAVSLDVTSPHVTGLYLIKY